MFTCCFNLIIRFNSWINHVIESIHSSWNVLWNSWIGIK